MNYWDHLVFYFKIVVAEKNSPKVSYPYYCTLRLKGDEIKPYVNAMKEAKHFISLTRPFRCDPRSTDPDFCQRILKQEDACCMKFEYNEEDDYSRYKSGFTSEYSHHLFEYMFNITGSLPIESGMKPVHLCSSISLMKDTHSIYVSEFKENRVGNGGTYKIGKDLLPEKQGIAQCIWQAYSGANILRTTELFGSIALFALMMN